MTSNELLKLLKNIKNKSISIKFVILNKYNYIVDITYDEKDRSIGMSTRGIFYGANWYEDTPEEHQEMVDYLHLESNDCITELIKK